MEHNPNLTLDQRKQLQSLIKLAQAEMDSNAIPKSEMVRYKKTVQGPIYTTRANGTLLAMPRGKTDHTGEYIYLSKEDIIHIHS